MSCANIILESIRTVWYPFSLNSEPLKVDSYQTLKDLHDRFLSIYCSNELWSRYESYEERFLIRWWIMSLWLVNWNPIKVGPLTVVEIQELNRRAQKLLFGRSQNYSYGLLPSAFQHRFWWKQPSRKSAKIIWLVLSNGIPPSGILCSGIMSRNFLISARKIKRQWNIIRILSKKRTEPNGSRQNWSHALTKILSKMIHGEFVWIQKCRIFIDIIGQDRGLPSLGLKKKWEFVKYHRKTREAVYLIGFMLPLLATLISYSGLFRYIRKLDLKDSRT